MNKREIYNQMCRNARLPTPSQVALEVMRLCYSDTSSLEDIARVVEGDSALSAEFLKYANSAIMGSSIAVASVQRAAVKIGLKGMVNLALSFSLLSQQKSSECTGFSYSLFWSKSLAQAVAGRSIASRQKHFDQDEIFTCCLLSKVGELGMATAFPDEYSTILSQQLGPEELLIAEQNAFNIDHNELTIEMFADWGIPKFFRLALQQLSNRHNGEVDDEIIQLANLFSLAQQIADICMLNLPLNQSFVEIEQLAESFGIPVKSFNQFFDEVVKTWQDWGSLYQIETQHCPIYYHIKNQEETTVVPQVEDQTKKPILILAVDDDPMTLLNLSRILQSDDRKIITAEDGIMALEMAKEHQPEMVITDWRMPQLDGLELCSTLRGSAITQNIYIVMLTGNESDDELVQAFDAGADDYVVKPFTPKVLEARIRSGERLIRYQRTINSDREVIQRYATKLASANRKLQTMAMTDTLTGLPNRRSAMARMKDAVAETQRFGEKLSCILIDIDFFKKVNDTYGHDNGDIVLIEIAKVFSKNARSYDMVSRMGGEEFLVISTRSDGDVCYQLAERLRSAVEQHTIALTNGTTANVTISLGVATWQEGYRHGGDLIKAADDALYKAKRTGRNKVERSW
ncbi:diguanylate cyclase [Desulfosediminicola flagellatus]|uniref:diguanylate cyclase n=1 Tax=Desulfosediminicola flagellatus TaxID=2569541 RepID=UPI0010ABE70A|nr:diguanylate cyclase [Desulfosediminicola flagellatus]